LTGAVISRATRCPEIEGIAVRNTRTTGIDDVQDRKRRRLANLPSPPKVVADD
jgi:hypothetical protein